MRALIFTEGGSKTGLGHISRCSSLYEELSERGFEVKLIIYSDIDYFEIIKDKQYVVENWLSPDYLLSCIKPSDYCIVDSYLAEEQLYHLISKLAKKALFIDDNGRIKYPKGIVVNPSLSNQAVKYPNNDTDCYLFGAKYIILRSPFINVKRENINIQVKEVLITIGGTDIHNLTLQILEELRKSYSNIKYNIVWGNALKNVEEIESIGLKNVNFYENLTADEMKSIMLRSDFAITAAGQTIYELLATQTPFIPIKVAGNQENNILSLKKYNLVETILEYNEPLFKKKLNRSVEIMMRFNIRKKLVDKYKQLIDGFGRKRIVDFLISDEYIEEKYFLRKVKESDIFDVFHLSNEEYVRKYSINSNKIEWEDHKVWFDKILHSNEDIFYVITNKKDQFLGQLRYKIQNDCAIISISLCKSIIGKGLSKRFVKESIELIREEKEEVKNIIAFVSNNNIPSKKLFESVGFVLHQKTKNMLKYVFTFD